MQRLVQFFRCQPRRPGAKERLAVHAFSLIELLVVIAIMALLAALLLPALNRAKQKAWTVACLNNLKQLSVCWHQYAGDNEDVMVPNNFVYYITPGGSGGPAPGEDSLTWCRSLAPLDTNAIGEATSLLFRYNQSPAIYRCPADRSTVTGRPDLLRNRSYNMSNSIQCSQADHYRKFTEIPNTASVFVFIDTHENDIWDSTFGMFAAGSPWQDYWLDVPADRHQRGANLSFADGHVERFGWRAAKDGYLLGQHTANADDLADLRKLQQHIKEADGH
ncbi:MAG TPA: prepilin-type N-terminal cleavage/methylation domain-containing protein [Verrucomicrobiae bacterium]|nr:prepilin-type N-terminal cleavage/methylation domain-containing protein [Verrucomicrobiae bacterium]